jgi:thiamine biosynthesis protein ThiI
MDRVILVRYAEIHLKGLNRPFFERLLADRIKQALNPVHASVEREQGRIFVYGIPEERIPECVDRLCRVFGIHSVSVACCVEKDWDAIREAALTETRSFAQTAENPTFKCFARRSDKRFPMTSEEICRELGHELLEAYPNLKVDVHHPALPVTVEIRQNSAFVYTGEVLGAGGMPVG